MKKMVLLAPVVALVALMLAATPAFAQDGDGDERVLICHTPPPNNFELLIPEDELQGHLGHGDFLGFCNDRDRDIFDRDIFDRDVFEEPFIEQDIEQEAESGDVDQSFDVVGGGDNSNQTVGIQGTANTGNVQNVIDVVDAGDFGDFNDNDIVCRDFDNDDDNNGICDNDEGFIFGDSIFGDVDLECDEDNDGDEEECRLVGDNAFIFGDDIFDNDVDVFGNDGFDELEFDEVGSSIEMSPVQNVTGNNQVNQAAAASANNCVPVWSWSLGMWVCA